MIEIGSGLRGRLISLLLLMLWASPAEADSFDASLARGRAAADGAEVDAAARAFQRALEAAGEPGAPSWQRPVALYYLGDLYYTYPYTEGADEAEGHLRASATLWKVLAGDQSPALAVVYVRLGLAQEEAGKLEAARESLARAEQIIRSWLPEDHPIVKTWPASAEMLHPDEFFAGAISELQAKRGPTASVAACTPPPPEPIRIDPGDTYLRASGEDKFGRPVFFHLTEADMPWRVSIAKPKRSPRYGSAAKAREVSIQAMQGWEVAIAKQLPWFQLEFVEDDPEAQVQINWKRRMTGGAAGRGWQRWWVDEGCIRVGGAMDIAVKGGMDLATHLSISDLELLVAHEFGHVLGLGHCLDCESAMNYSWHQRERIYVTDLDVRTFMKLMSIPNGATAANAVASE